ncbi:alpha-tocopherol transfer protein-like isoform X2 [Uranotaenia lowii]|nr:alpha-tocopherol transfer protein-like isoform X2 [Uranotaenia lowii]XP_055594965.1 alpha-tocopherol transfer protein-like isoform X2 [Uranotaenia lowii]XP_055594966.1 alpha-tocopherol transfer protein-like isoform X2 [Uranotaenia lowii]XP_055597637.1 alpha-tocopherol transfer protein-like isoform X2 [Uranotaenia lowii]XP_055597638.1 alpha-tocopherol transfer protein-like isoform X2 [Uranotaenia lowii]XP_055597639.1 alpha-tocopherol transfer protein-like isoform X2 [Uranotaenia lowii]
MLSEVDELPSVQLGDYVLRFELEDLTPFGRKVAQEELRETPEIKAQAVEELREMLKAQDELVVPSDNEAWLVRFLRPCKFYPKSAYELIQRYYQFKVKHADMYMDLSPSRETNIFKQNILAVFPNRDQLGRRILLIELGKRWKHKEVTLDEVFKGCVLFLEAAMLEPETQVHGAVVIFDMDGLSLQQAWQFTPPFAMRIVDWLQDAMPLRIKGIEIVNQPKIFNMVFALFKPFLRDKLRGRIVFHGTDRESLYKHISQECLPPCYGGTVDAPRVQGEQWYELLIKCDNEYIAINQYGNVKAMEEIRNKKNKKK